MTYKLIKQLTEDRMWYSYYFEDDRGVFVQNTLVLCRLNSDEEAHEKAIQQSEEKLKQSIIPREKETIKNVQL